MKYGDMPADEHWLERVSESAEWLDWDWDEFDLEPLLLSAIDFIVAIRPDLNTREDAFREIMFQMIECRKHQC